MAPKLMKRLMAKLKAGQRNPSARGSTANELSRSPSVGPEISLATKIWAGKTVNIAGVDGFIQCAKNGDVSTNWGEETGTDQIQIEHVDGDWVAFRVVGTNLYLTQHLYGDEARAELAKTLLENAPQILPELLPQIIEYLVDNTKESFEGADFNYNPMIGLPGPPNALQQFTLVPVREDDEYIGRGDAALGVKSRFGKFWRSEHWNHVVSQSPHLLGDETWSFSQA